MDVEVELGLEGVVDEVEEEEGLEIAGEEEEGLLARLEASLAIIDDI